ncbi:MAG: acyl-CoA desaturase [Tunicatimonas sp.]
MRPVVRFAPPNRSAFTVTLRQRVNQYFKDNNISRYGNREMVVKTVVLLGVYAACYLLVLTLPINPWWLLLLMVPMGISKAGIGMSVMHDALHGSYAKKKWVNQWVGRSIYLVGANPSVWKIQHNVLHHTFTNIHGLDEDINTKAIIRLSEHAPHSWFHRYQHIYALFLYGGMTLLMTINDFFKLLRYRRTGMVEKQAMRFDRECAKLVATKVAYLFFMLVLPVLVTALTWWQVLIGFMVMHLIAGYILSIVFQMAHVVEGAHQPLPATDDSMENAWAIHQLETTANFARDSRVLNWFVGGLNFQIEHHLFPNVCHVHYRKISDIVKKTAEDFQLPYNMKPTFWHAFRSHLRMLKSLGRTSVPA